MKLLLLSASIAGVTAIGGGALYLASNNSKKEKKNAQEIPNKSTVSSLLTGKRLLTKTDKDNGNWAAPWGKFKQAYQTNPPKTPWNFPQWAQNKSTDKDLDSFKEQWLSLGATEVTSKDNDTFKAVDNYCTVTA